MHRQAEAVPLLESAIASAPDDAELLALLAVAVVPADATRAFEVATAAVAADPETAWIRAVAADIAMDAGQPEAAVIHAMKARALDPMNGRHHSLVAAALTTNVGRPPPDAQRAARRATELEPHDPATWVTLGNMALRNNDIDDARRHYEHALRLEPDHPTAMSNLAAIEAHVGEMSSAIDMLQSIIRLDPRQEHARRQLDDVVVRLNQELLWAGLVIGVVLAVAIAGVSAVVG